MFLPGLSNATEPRHSNLASWNHNTHHDLNSELCENMGMRIGANENKYFQIFSLSLRLNKAFKKRIHATIKAHESTEIRNALGTLFFPTTATPFPARLLLLGACSNKVLIQFYLLCKYLRHCLNAHKTLQE